MVRRQYEGGEPEQPGEPGSKGQQGEGIHRYRMRQNLVAFGDDYWIENALGSRVFFVDGKAFRLREHLGFKDMQGKELAAIQEKVMRIKDTYSIYRKGNVLATVKKALITPLTSASMFTLPVARTWKCRATSQSMNMNSTRDATRQQKSRRSGFALPVRMAWISFPVLMIS